MNVREPIMAFAHASAAGQLGGVGWVVPRFDGEGYQIEDAPDGLPRLSGPPLVLPPPMRDAAEDAIAQGEAPLAEVLALLIAGPAWLIESRATLWTPLSAVPALLVRLVETYGVGVEIHRHHPERLARLAARVPGWYPYRGQLRRALELLDSAVGEPVVQPTAALADGGADPIRPPLRAERLACHSVRWWADRALGASQPQYRIEGNYLRFQPERTATRATGESESRGASSAQSPLQADPERLDAGPPTRPAAVLVRDDVLLGDHADLQPPTALLRLLPVWTTVRLTR